MSFASAATSLAWCLARRVAGRSEPAPASGACPSERNKGHENGSVRADDPSTGVGLCLSP